MSAENENKLSGSQWGRVLICGGTDWTRLGRRDRSGVPVNDEEDAHPDLLEPHILRSLSNVKITSVHTGCAACHFVALDVDGNAWLWGRNGSSCLGVSSSSTKASARAGSKPIAIDAVSENAPMKINPVQDLGAQEGTKFVDATCGRNHTLLVGSGGQVWTAGTNTLGQCGHAPCPEIAFFKPVSGFGPGSDEEEHAVKVSAGITFSLVLTQSGKVFSFGSGEKGQLGNGATGERITTGNKVAFDVADTPYYIKELDGKKIVQISSGQQHSAAMDDEGNVYVWGYNGYCRLGLGNQTDVLKPKPVPQFAAPTNGSSKDNHNNNKEGEGDAEGVGMATVVCGPSNTVVVDRNGMYWMAGKWKNSGEGSSGSPYSSFRIIQDIMACKVNHAACGGVTHWLVTPNDDENEKASANGTGVATMTVAWGQNASNGELGLGPDEPKSSTKPTKHIPLDGIEVLQIAAGQNTTAFLVKPTLPLASSPSANAVDGDATGDGEGEDGDGDKYSNLPRHPEQVEDVPDFCLVCNKDHGEDDSPLECEKCDNPYHLGCLSPPLSSVPPGEWFCPKCVKDPGAPLARFKVIRPTSGGVPSASANVGGGTSRTATPADQDVDMQDVNGTGSRRSKSKRKASGSGEGGGRGGAKKKRQ